nr:hypothetical protein [Gemmatimonadaceae bacterium]
ATRAMRDPRDFTAELAQVAVAAGRWGEAGRRWRTALAVEPALAGAAVATLGAAPDVARDTIRAAMGGAPPVVAARRALAELELAWGAPRRGWAVLAELSPSEETAAAWRAFAEAAEERQAPLVARDAWAALARWRRDPEVALRGATAALDGGDAAGALPFTAVAQSLLAPSLVLRDVLPVRLRALAALGRAADAAALVDSVRPALAPLQLRVLESQLGWAFLRAGDVTRARPLVPRMDDDEAAALLAVYEGDFARARTLLAGADASNTLLLVPRTLLARSRATTAPQAGRGLAALARADTVAAVAAFEAAAVETPDAAPLLPTAPEAIEADLAWARLALAAGDATTAIARLEHLILTWPTSALVPQARRTLDEARRRAGGPS